MTENSRELAYKVYKRIIEDKGYSNLVLQTFLKRSHLSQQDKALVSRIVYGTLQWQGLLDHYLKQLSSKPFGKLSNDAVYLLRLGAYQLLFLNKVPDSASVNETVKVAKKKTHRGIASFLNGILRNLIRKKDRLSLPSVDQDPIKYLAACYSHPKWMVEMWYNQYGFDITKQLLINNNEVPEHSIRTNTTLTDKYKLIDVLKQYGIESEEVEKIPEALIINNLHDLTEIQPFKDGLFQIQDINSMLVSHFVSPKSDDKIIDLCSAPGGKTTHLAQMMKDKGEILALDIHEHRVNLVKKASDRLHLNSITPMTMDATKLINNEYSKYHNKFEICLVDAPCSGLGTLRRRPELKWNITKDDIKQLTQLQKNLLETGAKLVKPGGKLVYSTCTVSLKENYHQIVNFLENNTNFSEYIPEQVNNEFSIGEELLDKGLQLLPDHKQGDGFYMVSMKKVDS
ncbi:16S rRNA (cytosine(967)-C(5))-methyltransferase RsmB [Natranaerobius trueperi]|uniref:16S rRNA (cytosine(967)-C(5))-methyltransferase n=1 Tax=Natranaerobius trueperi TaxID=759412 RepID=A0A226C183_9FIRM|nr:16S rRNA (cytosine(967)-C(5))-methyltransferase RsmB [Natranaerobius trueperi]OWZ84167.1 16S rRNA (cytosine(967)-C(5))-methyltransferase [Natranaerobius trueperi]